MITLYAKDATDFTTNGLGVLDGGIATVPEVEEAFNGAYTLTLRYVSWGRYRDLIDYDCIIKAPTPDGDQRFRIYKITKQIGFVEIVANHIFYDLAGNFIEDANLVDQNGGDALNHIGTSLQSPTNFTFKSNIEATASARLVRLNAVQALLDTSQDNSFVNRWGGELLRDNDQVIFNAVRGSNRGFSVKYGKNLTSYEATIDTTTVVTRIMPYGYDGLMIPEKYVDSDLIDKYPFVHVKKIEYSEIKAIDPDSDSNEDDAVPLEDAYALLRAAAQNEYITNHVDQPQANFKVSFQDLQKTREYADFEALETLLPWDYVSVDADGLPIDARMISYRYDPLNQRYIEVELGNYVSEYTDTVAGKVDSLSSSLMKVSEQASHAALSANGKNTNYYGTATPSNPVDGDLWYKQNGDTTELWQYDGKSVPPGWKLRVSDLTGQEISDKVDNALKEFDAVKQAADKAVEQANIAVTQSGLSQESAKAAAEAVQAAQAIAQEVSASLATAQAQAANAAGDAAEALKEAQDALAAANGQSAQVKSLQQIVDDTTGTISTLAKQVDVDTVTQQVKTTQTLAQQTAAGLLLKSDQSVVDTLSGTVKQQSIELKAAQDQLALKLTANDLAKGLSGYATQTWASQQITATANTWSTQLNSLSAKYDSMSLGTRNYIQDSSFELGKMTIAGVSAGYKASFIGAQTAGDFPTPFGSQMLQFYQPTGVAAADAYVILALPQPIQIKAGETWTTSYYYAVAGGMQGVAASNYLLKSSSDGDVIGNAGAHFQYPGGDHSAWTRAVFTWTATADGVVSALRFGAVSTSTTAAWVVIDNIQLEKGNIVSDHHPAPEDSAIYTDQRSAELFITLDQYKQQLAATTTTANTATTNIQSMQATVTSTSSLLATVQTTVGSLRSAGANLVYNGDAELGLDGWTSNHMNLTGLSTHNYWYNGTKQFFRLYPNGTGTNDENCFSSKSIPVKRNTIYHLHFHWIAPMDISSIDVLQGQTSADYLTNAWKPASDSGVYDKDFNTGNRDSVVIRIDLNGSTDGNANVWLGLSEICLTEGAGIVPYSPSAANSATVTAFNSVQSTVDGTVQSIGSINGQLTTINNSIKGVQTTVAGKASTSQFTQLDNQITSVIGGLSNPNLILNSKYPTDKSLLGWLDTSNLTIAVHNFYSGGGATLFEIVNATKGTDSTSEKTVGTNRFKLTRNTDYTVSLWAFASGNTSGMDVYILKRKRGSTNAFDNDGVVQLMSNNTKLSAIQTVKYTLHFNSGDFDEAYLRVDNNGSTDGTNSVLFFAEPKVELGSLATPDVQSGTDSQITQLQDAINLRVTKDGIISQINMTAGKTLIQNNTILLDASTVTMGGTAFINAANIKSVNATTIPAGKLDASLIDVVGLNAKSITTGTITGENLSINLATGEVTFAKGAIKSTNGRLNIDVNDGTFAQSDGTKGMLFADGNLYLSSASWWDQVSGVPYTKPDYGFIGYTDTLLTARGFGVIGRDALTLGLTDNGNPGMEYTSSPVINMTRSNVTLNFAGELATIEAGKGFTIKTNSVYNLEQIPGIQIGSNVDRSGIGDRTFIDGSYVYIPSAYSRTSSGSANLIVAADGAIVRTSSATKYKSDIQRFSSTDAAERFLEVPQAHWLNKQDLQRYSDDPQHYKFPEYDFGMIAEDLAAKGLEDFVVRGADGQLEDIRYDRIAPALLPLIKEMKLEIDTLKEELKS